jgi:hypothetical protein
VNNFPMQQDVNIASIKDLLLIRSNPMIQLLEELKLESRSTMVVACHDWQIHGIIMLSLAEAMAEAGTGCVYFADAPRLSTIRPEPRCNIQFKIGTDISKIEEYVESFAKSEQISHVVIDDLNLLTGIDKEQRIVDAERRWRAFGLSSLFGFAGSRSTSTSILGRNVPRQVPQRLFRNAEIVISTEMATGQVKIDVTKHRRITSIPNGGGLYDISTFAPSNYWIADDGL